LAVDFRDAAKSFVNASVDVAPAAPEVDVDAVEELAARDSPAPMDGSRARVDVCRSRRVRKSASTGRE
jgi:hypothetical protein